MVETLIRTSPEEALRIANSEKRGKLKIFLGYAPGVGKTYAMLNEGRRRVKYGQKVVIGCLDSHGRKDTEGNTEGLTKIPMKEIKYRDKIFEVIDIESIIEYRPEVVLIDELAKTNPPSCKNKKRYEDVLEILAAGINVLTTLNIQHIDRLNFLTTNITRVNVSETIPDEILEKAEEVIVIDIPPEELIKRVKEGKVFNESIREKTDKFFQKNTLSALRELCLKATANEVEEDLFLYMKQKNITSNWHVAERIMVIIDTDASARRLIIRGDKMASKFDSELFVVAAKCKASSIFIKRNKRASQRLSKIKKITEKIKGEFVLIDSKNYVNEIKKFIEDNFITCVIIGNSTDYKKKYRNFIKMNMVTRLIKKCDNVEFHIIPIE